MKKIYYLVAVPVAIVALEYLCLRLLSYPNF